MIKWFLWCTLLLAGARASASVNGCFVAGGLNELHFGIYDPSNANAVKKKLDLRIQCDKPNPIKISFGPSQHSGEINTRKMQGWVNQGVPSINYLRYNLYKYLSGTVLGQGDAALVVPMSGSGEGLVSFGAWIDPGQQVGTGYYEDGVVVTLNL